ncbi:MAG: hypothetical protein WA865_03375 [Spirulinaceae cyanobacterium]
MKKPSIFRTLFSSLPITAAFVVTIVAAPAFAVTLPTIDTNDTTWQLNEVALEIDVNIEGSPVPNNRPKPNRPAPNNNQSAPNRPTPNNRPKPNRPAPNNNQPAPNNNRPVPNPSPSNNS